MQAGGVMRGANAIPRRRRLNALMAGVAVLAIAALVALMVWVGPLGFNRAKTGDTVPGAGTAVIHDDAGNVHPGLALGYATVYDDSGNVHPTAGTAIVHDDAGNVNR